MYNHGTPSTKISAIINDINSAMNGHHLHEQPEFSLHIMVRYRRVGSDGVASSVLSARCTKQKARAHGQVKFLPRRQLEVEEMSIVVHWVSRHETEWQPSGGEVAGTGIDEFFCQWCRGRFSLLRI